MPAAGHERRDDAPVGNPTADGRGLEPAGPGHRAARGRASFGAPAHVLEAARRAYAAGDTHYVPNAGIPALRAELARKLRVRNGLDAEPSQVVVSAGGAQALHLTLSLTVAEGDEVLVPDPGWPNFAMAVQLLQASPVRYPCARRTASVQTSPSSRPWSPTEPAPSSSTPLRTRWARCCRAKMSKRW